MRRNCCHVAVSNSDLLYLTIFLYFFNPEYFIPINIHNIYSICASKPQMCLTSKQFWGLLRIRGSNNKWKILQRRRGEQHTNRQYLKWTKTTLCCFFSFTFARSGPKINCSKGHWTVGRGSICCTVRSLRNQLVSFLLKSRPLDLVIAKKYLYPRRRIRNEISMQVTVIGCLGFKVISSFRKSGS